ncbi:NAD-dependent deacylase [Pseudomonas sp. AP19]|uniref:SIR2 family NAD-dependent protein deacylase n=1 Tax=Pseudomonas TaxID=286 RepID=UPI00084BB41A|nr:NAD-dependent deacylase [Pseudomonas sp. AP19]OEC68255.1 NAD-dependent deacylase [Pseudomonas sp. AP19]
MNELFDTAAACLKRASKIVVFTGAGASAESGIATFRDALTGLWERFDAQRLATAPAFKADPSLVWGWYEWRRAQAQSVHPNPGHVAVCQLARHVSKLTIVTQNVDSLHERAGSDNVLHLHGSLNSPRCFECASPMVVSDVSGDPLGEGSRIEPPSCPECGGLCRPGVVWFGESLPADVWEAAVSAVAECDVLLSIGTSGAVYPAAALPKQALSFGAVVIHINSDRVAVSAENEISLVGKGGVILPQLLARAFS